MEEAEGRPWEQPGQARRDAEPHRGGLLFLLAATPTALGVLAPILVIALTQAPLPYARDLAALVAICLTTAGLLVSVTTLLLTGRDLGKMQTGMMDCRGKALTDEANHWALSGLLLNLALFFLAAAFVAARLS